MLRQAQLISLLDRALNQTSYIRKGVEAVYYCPFCRHHKRKLEVNVDTEKWHCWVCHKAGMSIKSFFKNLNVHDAYYVELFKITGKKEVSFPTDADKDIFSFEVEKKKTDALFLPKEFIPLWKNVDSFKYNHAKAYVKSRGITEDDIVRYNICYCEEGDYKNRIIIPSYDKDGRINFFAARDFYESSYKKYMLPPWSKNIIGFELFINWNEPITLTEGTFDAVAIRKNAIPLFGTTMSRRLKEAIVENKVKRVNIVLDNDALKRAVDIYTDIEKLKVADVDVHLIKLEDKDPSKLGFETINKIIEMSESMSFDELVMLKLSLL